ncbi:nucleoside-binding protein [Albimonas donghaensis]|uniref:Nucleoside-binding protein n=1 Tax=Albimonas donghaensis TaxID=356660 RepID=A0A1H3AKJ0_9RHOB|nr:BMP family ABC transporter substrate-binding protein [Albimonas donghaensis]SDX30222.1 nucleoside-binding protein [Albimonas donghaensis]
MTRLLRAAAAAISPRAARAALSPRAVLSAALFAAALAAIPVPDGLRAEPGLVYSTGGKFDKSFNEGAFHGARAWAERTGETFAEFEIDGPAQSEQALRAAARRGLDPIVAIGFTHAQAMAKIAPEYPDAHFVIVDSVVDQPNVRSIVYREHEGGFLVGLLGVMASKTQVLGFVGGMDIPLIRKFACGYIQGARAANPSAEVLVNMVGDTPAAWTDPARGAELAISQIERGADVVMQAAGGTGLGVLQAAADRDVLGIGTDSNQNWIHPGQILTTMLKRVDVAVQEVFSAAGADFEPGISSLGVAEGGIGWALDAHNRDLISPDMEQAVNEAAELIADGRIKVHDSTTEGPCPVK